MKINAEKAIYRAYVQAWHSNCVFPGVRGRIVERNFESELD